MAKAPDPVALAKRAGCMLAGEDFILRRAKAEPTGREVIVHIDDRAFAELVIQSRASSMTPARFARHLIEHGLSNAGDVKHSGQFAEIQKNDDLADRLRTQLDAASRRCALLEGALEQEKATVARLRGERDQHQAECETLETLLNDEKIANAKLFSELHAPREERTAPAAECGETEAKLEQDRSYGLCRKAKAEAPPSEDAPLTKSFVKIVVGYRYANTSIEQIARILECDVASVRRALEVSGGRK